MYIALLNERLTIFDKGSAIISLIKCNILDGMLCGPVALAMLILFIILIISCGSVGFMKKTVCLLILQEALVIFPTVMYVVL